MEGDDFGTTAADPFSQAGMPHRGQQDASYQSSSRPGVPASRSASVAVYSSSPAAAASLSPAPQSVSAASRKRASHTVAVSNNTANAPPPSSRGQSSQYTDVYSLPAAVAYAAAHPRRQIPKFGPYLLLQTLGEGEFGKVKLGLHQEYGEEVAVKLIRRGSVDNAVRFSKIEREIEVLKNIRHPNIVRLYDVIETDKYIGIILEYASGGELFDHILAHRYLRERDAAKLFAQLVSGVSYIHAKKIVHRDLKLENLLLDRNRNVIITDFGFANKFEHKSDDLMQTSCGSPCYAAPELVISEGLYVGSAVDIWSCGVILYAMLAGYLPFDDDPANPDGDNINLLYKYIINTQLTFPDYVSAEARDLLNKMLVPDPAKRCDLDGVKRHPWLKAYSSLFEKSVEELEHQAMEMQNAKRLQYQKMMRQREREAALQQQQQQSKMSRTQSARLDGSGAGGIPMSGIGSSSASTRTRSGHQQHEFLYETGGSDLVLPTTGRRAVASAIIPTSHAASMDEDPFGSSYAITDRPQIVQSPSGTSGSTTSRQHGKSPYDDTSRSRKSSASAATKPSGKSSAGPPPVSSPTGTKKKGGYRHTIQLEYDDGDQSSSQPPIQAPPQAATQPNGYHTEDVEMASPNSTAITTITGPPFLRGDSSMTDNSLLISSNAMNGAGETITSFTSNGITAEGAVEIVDMSYSTMPNMEPLETEEAKEKEREREELAGVGMAGQETPRKQTARSPSRENSSNATPRGKKTPSIVTAVGAPPSPIATPKGSVRSHASPVAVPPSPSLKRNAATEPMVPTKGTIPRNDDSDRLGTPVSSHPPSLPPQSPSVSMHTHEERSPRAGVSAAERLLTPSASSAASVTHSISTSSNKSASRHRKGLSLDKINLGKLLGSTKTDQSLAEKGGADKTRPPTSGPKSSLGPPTSFDQKSVSPGAPTSGGGSETGSTKSKSSRRKTLTLMMVEPFGTAKAAVRDRSKSHRSVTGPIIHPPVTPSSATDQMENSPLTTGDSTTFASEKLSPPTSKPVPKKPILPPTPALDTPNDMGMNGGSTGKAKKVMDWFRKRSLAKSAGTSTGDTLFSPVLPPARESQRALPSPSAPPEESHYEEPSTPTADTYRHPNGDSTSSLNGAPQVVVTAAVGGQPSNWDPTPRSASGTSHASTDTSTSNTPPAGTAPASSSSHIAPVAKALANAVFQRNNTSTATTPADKPFNKSMLRVHHGAVDQGTITTGFPPETMRHVTAVLVRMGIEVQRESEFKYRCIRHKRKKGVPLAGLGIGGNGGAGVMPVSMTGAAASNGVDRRGLPIPSSTSAFGATGGMLRGLLLRRGSHAPSPTPSHSQGPSFESSEDPSLGSPTEAPEREPIFGDRTVDQQDEVRFSVELTRLDRLEDTFSLDVRRLKGNLRSYKFLYDLIRERATLAR